MNMLRTSRHPRQRESEEAQRVSRHVINSRINITHAHQLQCSCSTYINLPHMGVSAEVDSGIPTGIAAQIV
jgi:hypothetical protein